MGEPWALGQSSGPKGDGGRSGHRESRVVTCEVTSLQM